MTTNSNQALLDRGAPGALDRVARRVHGISTLPAIALKIVELANDPDSGAPQMKAAVESDAALAARVLRCVNSSAYAVRTRITNLQQAIAYLGLKQIRNLAITASVGELFKAADAIGTYRRTELWKHLVSVGLCARLIAMRLRMPNFEDVFLAGLLHDIGIILEDEHDHQRFVAMIGSLDAGRPLMDVEREHLDYDHTLLGRRIAEDWGFPETVQAAVRFHHRSEAYRGDLGDTVRCVEAANLMCTLKGITSVGLKLVRFSQPVLTQLNLGRDDISILSLDLDEALSANVGLFTI
ncbi:MAG: HDOD domain-containing protein [Thermoguttaceae bacterium]